MIPLCCSFSLHLGKNSLYSLSVSRYTAGKVCSGFLPAKVKDCHMLCTNCVGKCCTASGHCAYCHDLKSHEKLTVQWKKERKVTAI